MLWEEALEAQGDLSYALEELAEGVRTARSSSRVDSTEEALYVLAEDEALFQVRDPATAPGGVYGYGLLFDNPQRPQPAVVVESPLAPFSGAPVQITPFGVVHARSIGLTWPTGTVAVGLPPPQRQLGQVLGGGGARIRVGSELARLGIAVSAPEAVRGFTTAGHAAQTVPVAVRNSDGRVIGTAVKSLTLERVPPAMVTADMALINLGDAVVEHGAEQLRGVRSARARDDVSLIGGRSGERTWIRLISPEMALRTDIGAWGQVALTASAISRGGDSGAPVVGLSGEVLGQIVAGYEGVYSVIQDMEYCLGELGATLR